MQITIPYRENDTSTFIEVTVLYDVIATGGPPNEAPFGISVTGFRFIERWRIDDPNASNVTLLEVADDYINPETGNVDSPYDDFIQKFLEKRAGVVQEFCRDFELTNADNMV